MAAIERIEKFRRDFFNRHLRPPTAREVASGLHLDIAQPDTIRRAMKAADMRHMQTLQELLS